MAVAEILMTGGTSILVEGDARNIEADSGQLVAVNPDHVLILRAPPSPAAGEDAGS
jgi:hypothetical protein